MIGWLRRLVRIGYRGCSTSSPTYLLGRSTYKRTKYSEHGLLALLHPRQIFVVDIHVSSDGDRSLLLRATAEDIGVLGVQGGVGGGVSDNASLVIACHW